MKKKKKHYNALLNSLNKVPMRISDELLNKLAEEFIRLNLIKKGWEFHQFVDEYQRGYICIQ